MRGYGIGFFRIENFSVYFYILHAILAVNRMEHAVRVQLYGGIQISMDLEGNTGNLLETAGFCREIHNAHFQRVQNLLSGCFHHTDLVSERLHADNVAVSDISGRDISPDSAAVAEADIRSGDSPVRVRAEVAQVGLTGADKAYRFLLIRRGGIVHDKGNVCFGNYFV